METNNTVLGKQKGHKIDYDKIFWSVSSKLCIISFVMFALCTVLWSQKLKTAEYHFWFQKVIQYSIWENLLIYLQPKIACKFIWRWLFHQRPVDTKKWFFRPPMMSFAFLDMIFGGKGLQIDTYKPLKCIWSYHTHVVNTRWPKWSRRP